MVFARKLTPRLRRSLRRLDDGTRPIAELNRLVGAQAEHSGGVRPSYEQVRRVVHASRLARTPVQARIVIELRVLPPERALTRLLRRFGLRRRAAPVFVTTCYVPDRWRSPSRPAEAPT